MLNERPPLGCTAGPSYKPRAKTAASSRVLQMRCHKGLAQLLLAASQLPRWVPREEVHTTGQWGGPTQEYLKACCATRSMLGAVLRPCSRCPTLGGSLSRHAAHLALQPWRRVLPVEALQKTSWLKITPSAAPVRTSPAAVVAYDAMRGSLLEDISSLLHAHRFPSLPSLRNRLLPRCPFAACGVARFGHLLSSCLHRRQARRHSIALREKAWLHAEIVQLQAMPFPQSVPQVSVPNTLEHAL